MSNAERILKEHICKSCYDETLHSLVNTPVEQVESAMQAHTNATLQELKEKVGEYFKNEKHEYEIAGKKVPLALRNDEEAVFQLIDEAMS